MKHDVAELLPFYANGTLDRADRARVEAELAACPSCTEELDELLALGATLRERAEAVPPPPARLLGDVLARLDAAAGAVYPAAGAHFTRSVRWSPPRARWWALPARYAAATALVVGVGAAAVAGWHARLGEGHGAAGGPSAQQARKLIVVHRAPAAPGSEQQPRLAKHARLELTVGDVATALRGARDAVRAVGGGTTTPAGAPPRGADPVHGAELAAEVPADRLDAALEALAALGTVRARTIAADDLGDTLADEEARLTDLRREEHDLRALLDRSGKAAQPLKVERNLSETRGRIEQLATLHQRDLHRVATSAIALSLSVSR